jgi:hypothetical protein
MDQRTRERLPVLPVLVRTANERRTTAAQRLQAASNTEPGALIPHTNPAQSRRAHGHRAARMGAGHRHRETAQPDLRRRRGVLGFRHDRGPYIRTTQTTPKLPGRLLVQRSVCQMPDALARPRPTTPPCRDPRHLRSRDRTRLRSSPRDPGPGSGLDSRHLPLLGRPRPLRSRLARGRTDCPPSSSITPGRLNRAPRAYAEPEITLSGGVDTEGV